MNRSANKSETGSTLPLLITDETVNAIIKKLLLAINEQIQRLFTQIERLEIYKWIGQRLSVSINKMIFFSS